MVVAICMYELLSPFYLGAKGMTKTMFLPLVPVDRVEYFLGGKGMFLCFYDFTNCAWGHGSKGQYYVPSASV
jgi:hypothetical protein